MPAAVIHETRAASIEDVPRSVVSPQVRVSLDTPALARWSPFRQWPNAVERVIV
jgi:hypothetical protein